nr:DUF551 domain-containing protein [Klebsiella pneumoniae]
MTKSIITRERAQQIFLGNGPEPSASEERELARMALAAMDSEPVAWLLSGGGAKNVVCFDSGNAYADPLREVTPLYRHAQPVPVVSADLLHTAASAIEDLLEHTDPNTSYYSGVWADVPGKLRAAAPQLPGSEPATVPGKWIPVSERMPEDRTQVILWDAEIGEVTSGHYSHKTQTFYHRGDAIENEITHWMLPPSAPQGVKP